MRPETHGALLLDECDRHLLAAHDWTISQGYVRRREGTQSVLLHREIFGAEAGQIVDHVNRHTLDCRRSNLRGATKTTNAYNSATYSSNTTGAKNVYWQKQSGRWLVQLKAGGVQRYIGKFTEFEAAVEASRKAREAFHKEFACHE